jgi:hypothetical protein
MFRDLLRMMFHFAANEGGAGGGGGATPPAEPPATPPTDPTTAGGQADPAKPDAEAKFTQADLDRIAAKTRSEEKKKFEDERKKAEMTEAERLTTEKAEAEKQTADLRTQLNTVKIEAEAKVQAAAAGVKPEHLAYVMKLADLSGVAVNDGGAVDGAAVKTAIEAVLTALPALKSSSGVPAAGGDFGVGGPGPLNLDQQILEAEGKSDWKRAGELKALKMVNLQSKT